MINWQEQAIEYLKEYGNDDTYIQEWVESLVPIYYYDIMQEALRLELYHATITKNDADQKIWEIFSQIIYQNYSAEFYGAYFEQLEFMEEE